MSHIQIQRSLAEPKLLPAKLPLAQSPEFQEYLKLSQKQWVFSDLLHMDKEKTILANNAHKIKVLNLLKHLYTVAAQALEAFYGDRHVHLFDPHVGEASCQIRAIKIALMARNLDLKTCTERVNLAKHYKRYVISINNFIRHYNTKQYIEEGKLSLKKYLKLHRLDIITDPDDLFIILSYILSKYKTVISIEKDVINFSLLCSDWNIKINFSKKIIKKFQCLCSFYSVHYNINMIKSNKHNYQLFSYLLKKDDLGRWVLPTYDSMKVLTNVYSKAKIPLLLHVYMPLSGNNEVKKYKIIYINKRYYRYDDVAQHFKNTIAINYQCFINNDELEFSLDKLLNRLHQYDLEYGALANASAHHQYPGLKLQKNALNPYLEYRKIESPGKKFNKLQELRDNQAAALIHGFCHMNPKTLVICHMRCIRLDLL